MTMYFLFNDTATTEIYTLSLHDALPICPILARAGQARRPAGAAAREDPPPRRRGPRDAPRGGQGPRRRSEEHTSELQSRQYLVCRLLLEKKKRLCLSHSLNSPHLILTYS